MNVYLAPSSDLNIHSVGDIGVLLQTTNQLTVEPIVKLLSFKTHLFNLAYT